MGEVAELVTGVDRHVMTTLFVFGTVLLQVFVPYHRYVSFLKWLTLSLLAYAAVLFVVNVPWREVAIRTVWPRFALDSAAATVIVGIFGTTISPYLFFWQASEEVEDMQAPRGSASLLLDDAAADSELRRIRWDTWSGMFYSNVTAYFIILATAVTLHAAGVTNITTAAEAANALRPLAGNFAFVVFALGILGVGLIGVPVLAGSAAYALCEAMSWNWGLERKAGEAAQLLKLLANEKRLLVLCRLAMDGEVTVSDLAESIDLSQSALSQHLAKLRDDKLVATRRDGQSVHYRIADTNAARLLATLKDIYCA